MLSPDDGPGEVRAKVAEHLAHGVPIVVIVDPEACDVVVCRPSTEPETWRSTDMLDLDRVVPGFRCEVNAIFA